MSEVSIDIHWVQQIAREGGDLIRANIQSRSKTVRCKESDSDLVTETDCAVERLLIERIKERYPSHSFLCEESSTPNQTLSTEPTWIIDPIDGTTNFVHGVPLCAVSIGFAVNGVLMCGVVYNPSTDEMFYGEKGKGSFCNGERLSTTGEKEMRKALVTTGMSVAKAHRLKHESVSEEERAALENHMRCVEANIFAMVYNCADVRRFGSIALDMCMLAQGRVDGCIEMTPKEWDLAAAWVIVEEAGGVVRDYDNTPLDMRVHRALAAATPELAAQLSTILTLPTTNKQHKTSDKSY